MVVYGTIEGAVVTLDKNLDLNSIQLFDVDMTCMIQFKNDGIIVAAGVSHSISLSFFKTSNNYKKLIKSKL